MADLIDTTYEIVVGLEVHAQLLTESKLFCGDSAAFGGEPNTHISPITLGHPGTLPRLNKKAVEYAIRMGLACHSEISRNNYFARKNYFYPDLPKGYQLTQHTTPVCIGGYVNIRTTGGEKSIRLNRIHMEEDAGKSIHDADPNSTCVDYNRAGVPLVEIVTEPDIRSGDEAYAYLTELRKLLRYLAICDGNMEEGSMRCDANISVRKKGDAKLGTKVEVKNLNSIRNVKKAIEIEAQRLIGLLENGEPIIQQTRSFDAGNGTTFALRTKEDANDYRYFADPDLTPFKVTDGMLTAIRQDIPALPEERIARYTRELQLPDYDARVICDEKETADYFESVIEHTSNYKAVANWMLGPIKSWLNDNNESISSFPIGAPTLAALIGLVDGNQLNFSTASTRVLPALLKAPDKAPLEVAKELNLLQDSDEGNVAAWIEEVMKKMPDKVAEYQKGKKGLMGLFVGEVKKISKGKADPKLTNDILLKKLQS
ncbi:Asp-tRNA(Asn)/Glu-tRNA(Gln) amidotransferase subunit GatB [Paraflavitalea soli]|uniref:Aspartyl/glutamyl-tRNA(Asn/Gln) amidotransferase subunit B n=1 Tax=Paraflavitalea soli TaxID=2315862 RepID=A0A3B7MUW6_9BACT|nr:Asp-tRNA(Asn)/Glu-tRNA(Gln) amidotransferase subunit GatB [Paraflavitalea soli]AXY77183.1 Asp-tRNA(Asn)/Glu-tRNA(Gln) amidotransferase subunit GatB [Paraflavitalea soli]